MNHDDIIVAMQPYHAKLAALSTSEEVRDFLVAEGVRGVRKNAIACPIATYVSEGSGERARVTKVSTAPARRYPDHSGLRNTTAMAGFISRFDDGQYPELERPDHRALFDPGLTA